ncbi:hypothetical protein EV426DRAFT_721812 [Tirmania nivea]|nr:hypothetical protein EV426DRAFT_721812 [Tirmania nivea]
MDIVSSEDNLVGFSFSWGLPYKEKVMEAKVIEGRRKEIPYLILLFLPAGSQWLQMAVRGVEFRRNKMKVRAVFALAGSGWREEKEDMKVIDARRKEIPCLILLFLPA